MDKEYDVYSIGNPLIDILAQVNDDFLEDLTLNKGIMHLIDQQRRELILQKIPTPKIEPGGSAANTIIHLADLGIKTIYSGALGKDDIGKEFKVKMEEKGVITEEPLKSFPTGTSIILITPDAERTQNTFLGACQQYELEDVNVGAIQKSKYLYFTGYMWDTPQQKEALEHAIQVASEAGTKIVFDVADPFAVNRSKTDFLDLITKYADFVLTNREEATMLTDTEDIEEMIDFLRVRTANGVVKDGANGSYIFDKENIHHIKAIDVNAIDTTGAGDIYASGILYGLIKGYQLDKTGKIASYMAGKIVEKIGARLDYSIKEDVEELS